MPSKNEARGRLGATCVPVLSSSLRYVSSARFGTMETSEDSHFLAFQNTRPSSKVEAHPVSTTSYTLSKTLRNSHSQKRSHRRWARRSSSASTCDPFDTGRKKGELRTTSRDAETASRLHRDQKLRRLYTKKFEKPIMRVLEKPHTKCREHISSGDADLDAEARGCESAKRYRSSSLQSERQSPNFRILAKLGRVRDSRFSKFQSDPIKGKSRSRESVVSEEN